MLTLETVDAENRMPELLDRVKRGEEIVFTQDEHLVARMVAAKTIAEEENGAVRERRAAEASIKLAALRAHFKQWGVTFSAEEIRELPDAGRR